MKNKIKKFSKGDFRITKPEIVFPETHITMSVGEGEIYKGSFFIQNKKDGEIRGLVYPSSFRVHCEEQGFEENPVKVNFTYDGTGLSPGHVEKGKFTIVCDGGEYELAFTAIVERPFMVTSYGKIQNVEDFKKLAVKDFTEARRLFRTRKFYDVLKYEDDYVRKLYDNMRKWALDEQGVEEFLIGIKKKEKIVLSLSDDEKELSDIFDAKKDWVEITKSTWGYMQIRIRGEADFIKVTRTEVTTEDFVGNIFRLEYIVDAQKLHAGWNYGRIVVETPYQTLSVKVNVQQQFSHDGCHGVKELTAAQELKAYLAYLAGKTNVYQWMESAITRIKMLHQSEPDNEYYPLLQAHIYLKAGKKEEAKWILDTCNFSRFVIGRKPEISAYHLFLTSLVRDNANYTGRALEEMNRLYNRHPNSWQILCMLVNLDVAYANYNERIRVLERQFFRGANQILFYTEAYNCFQEKVVLLRKLGPFEIQVLNFAAKYKIISREVALYAAELISREKSYQRLLYCVLKNVYEMYHDEKILNAICMQLIKGNKTGAQYFKWYEKAVDQGLKIAQLYEYYMMSVDEQKVKRAFPKRVYLYFMHGNNLDYKRAALLYANILIYEDETSDIYRHYQGEIERFSWEQLMERHISDSLCIIYRRFLNEREMTPNRLEALYDICHAYRVKTKVSGMKYVLVIEKDGTVRQRIAYTEEGAQVYLYDKAARVVWEGKDGAHYVGSISYEARRLLYEKRFLEMCKNRITDKKDSEKEQYSLPVTLENLRLYGIQAFDEQKAFFLCTRTIREQEYKEDNFLIHLSFELLKRGHYDKASLTYLSNFYCGATYDMKMLWKKAREYGVRTQDLAERIIAQMLFTEALFQEEEIFEDYYGGKPYFRLKQAYLAYVSREFVVKERVADKKIFEMIVEEYLKKEYLPDICKVAALKFYKQKPIDEELGETLLGFLKDVCEQRIVFAFYLSYPERWLRQVQLHDKVIVEYRSCMNGRVKITYQINREEMEGLDYQTDVLLPVYENIYVKEFILYKGERLKYYFTEEKEEKKCVTEKKICEKSGEMPPNSRYGRLNEIIGLSGEARQNAMAQYQREDEIAKQIFLTY